MAAFEWICPSGNADADFAVRLENNAFSPLVYAGETLFFQRSAELADGDVGLFYTRGGMQLLQLCRDCGGDIYLFTLDRSGPASGVRLAPDAEMPVCYGRALLSRPLPLPMD